MNEHLEHILSAPPSTPFMLLRTSGTQSCKVLIGQMRECDWLTDLSFTPGVMHNGLRFASVSIIPFRQAFERGFDVIDGGERILSLQISACEEIPLRALCSAIPEYDLSIADGCFNSNDEEYAEIVRSIVRNEIESGEGANFVVSRIFRGRIERFSHAKALSAFKYLIETEYGAYWTFLLYTGERYFIGASPERLISTWNGTVRMNPISGTYRKDRRDWIEQKLAVLRFLEDEKEIFELFMVVDEELKVMADICRSGGQIVGPFMKEMSRLIHTEYFLVGHSERDPISQLRAAMHAATVTGSPVENAFRTLKRYESESRRYYGSAMVLLGEREHAPFLDSAITIRTVEIDSSGNLFAPVGATIVRNSIAENEVAETKAKLAALLDALQGVRSPSNQAPLHFERDEDILVGLSSRNSALGRFWLDAGEKDLTRYRSILATSCRVCIIDNEDRFVGMLAHMLRAIGTEVVITSWRDVRDLHDLPCDVIVLGPGPGDPSNRQNPRIDAIHRIVQSLLEQRRPLLAVCLGHQILCSVLGFTLRKRRVVAQGRQATINLFGRSRVVGFYNSFVASGEPYDGDTCVVREGPSGEVVALRAPRFVSFQFHAESILTQEGPEIVGEALEHLLLSSTPEGLRN